jgi:hypothetical protein
MFFGCEKFPEDPLATRAAGNDNLDIRFGNKPFSERK